MASGYAKDTFHAIALGQQGDLTDSEHVVWSLDRGTPYVPCPMLWGDEIYLLEDRSFFSCLGAVDGEPHYLKHRLPGVLNFSASPVGAADRIYLLSEGGRTVVLKRGPQLEVLAVNSLDETFYASPAIVGNEIYLRGEKHLFCFSKSGNRSHFFAHERRGPTRELVWGGFLGRRAACGTRHVPSSFRTPLVGSKRQRLARGGVHRSVCK